MTTETRYRQLVEKCNDAIVVSDRQGVITLWNEAAQRMFGFSAEEALGRSLDIFIPENQRQRHWEGYRKVVASGETRYATRLLAAPALCKGGERLSTEFSITLLKDDDGEVSAMVAVMRDVTERWQREKELRLRIAALEKAAAGPAD